MIQIYIFILFITINYNAQSVLSDWLLENNNVFSYQNESDKNETLPTCLPYAVCSVVHKRFWLPPIVRTFCKCEGTEECPARWHQNINDPRTMKLDSRSQLKFCKHIIDLPKCETGQPALRVKTTTDEETNEQEITAIANCECKWPIYWSLFRHNYRNFSNGTSISNDVYKCNALQKCKVDEFCGNRRADTFSVYYQCSCPKGSLCLHKDRKKYFASELLYKGQINRATCQNFKMSPKG